MSILPIPDCEYILVAGHPQQEPYRIRKARSLAHLQDMIVRYTQRPEVSAVAAFKAPAQGQAMAHFAPFLDMRLEGGVWWDRCSAAYTTTH